MTSQTIAAVSRQVQRALYQERQLGQRSRNYCRSAATVPVGGSINCLDRSRRSDEISRFVRLETQKRKRNCTAYGKHYGSFRPGQERSLGHTKRAHPTTYAFRACDSLCYRKISIKETENGKPKDKNNACEGRKCSARAFYCHTHVRLTTLNKARRKTTIRMPRKLAVQNAYSVKQH